MTTRKRTETPLDLGGVFPEGSKPLDADTHMDEPEFVVPLENLKMQAAKTVTVDVSDDPTYTGDIFTSTEPHDNDTYRRLVEILSPQKGKRSAPTLISFESTYAHARRWVIIDINVHLLDEAWRYWKSTGGHDDEVFLDYVYKITHNEVPRMFRVVATYDLK